MGGQSFFSIRVLAEQINPFDGVAISVSPLVWSHAEFVIAVCEYVDKRKKLAEVRSVAEEKTN